MPLIDRLDNWPRIKHAYLLGIGWWAVLVAAWGLLSFSDTIVSRVASEDFQKTWAAWWVHPSWGWKTWLLGVCIITTIVIFEGSYRKARRQEQQHSSELKAAIAAKDSAFSQMVIEKDEAYGAIVRMKDGEVDAAMKEKNAAIHGLEQTLGDYSVVWRDIQVRSRKLAIDLREYCELTGPAPVPPLIAGENDADLLVRQTKLRLPWMDKITYEYNKDFADRVAGLRDEFAMHGHRDFKLEYRINTAVVDTDQMMEIADRLMGLAFRELAKRQLRVTTMKQLCCD